MDGVHCKCVDFGWWLSRATTTMGTLKFQWTAVPGRIGMGFVRAWIL